MKIVISMSKKEFDESKNLLAAILEENVPDCKENEQMENKIGKFSSSITDDEITRLLISIKSLWSIAAIWLNRSAALSNQPMHPLRASLM